MFLFLLSVFLKCCANYKLFSNNIPLNKSEERNSENSLTFINSHSKDLSIVAYALTFFIITIATLYLISLPYSIFLFIILNKNIYYKPNNFQILYIFVIINMIAGFILFYFLLIIVFVKRVGLFRQRSFSIDDNN